LWPQTRCRPCPSHLPRVRAVTEPPPIGPCGYRSRVHIRAAGPPRLRAPGRGSVARLIRLDDATSEAVHRFSCGACALMTIGGSCLRSRAQSPRNRDSSISKIPRLDRQALVVTVSASATSRKACEPESSGTGTASKRSKIQRRNCTHSRKYRGGSHRCNGSHWAGLPEGFVQTRLPVLCIPRQEACPVLLNSIVDYAARGPEGGAVSRSSASRTSSPVSRQSGSQGGQG
jgi:hypothetical protein